MDANAANGACKGIDAATRVGILGIELGDDAGRGSDDADLAEPGGGMPIASIDSNVGYRGKLPNVRVLAATHLLPAVIRNYGLSAIGTTWSRALAQETGIGDVDGLLEQIGSQDGRRSGMV